MPSHVASLLQTGHQEKARLDPASMCPDVVLFAAFLILFGSESQRVSGHYFFNIFEQEDTHSSRFPMTLQMQLT